MTKLEIIENNKLIAEFMGNRNFKKDGSYETFIGEHIDTDNGWVTEFLSHTKYHKSWDWLIPVVKKIEKLMTNWNKPNYENGYSVWMNKFRYAFWDINCLYEYIVDFIKWYNKQK